MMETTKEEPIVEDLSRGEFLDLRNVEYEQMSQDWRHRDQMTWQSLALSVTLTGAMFGFMKDLDNVIITLIIWALAVLFNYTILIRIIKDNYYQMGSIETILYKLGGIELVEDMYQTKETSYTEDYNLRRIKPSKEFFEASVKGGRVPYPFLYKQFFLKVSAYKMFIFIQICLVLLTFCAFIYELYKGMHPYIQRVYNFLFL
jgi:hypothetical protein